jgi:F0F1-type ATP synthase membrane subunit b/b'
MLNEEFWVFLAFVCLMGISFRHIKKSVLANLDDRIKSVEESIVNGESAKQSSHEKLLSLKKDYDKALVQYKNAIEEAKVEAQNIINDTEAKVKILDERAIEIMNEYRQQSDTAMIESLKGDILMTIINLLESEQKENKGVQLKGVEDSISVMKKIWN